MINWKTGVLMVTLLAGVGRFQGLSQENALAVPESPPTNAAAISTNVVQELAEQQLRSYLKLQEQLHSALLVIEQARNESSEETRASAAHLSNRIELLERTLAQERTEQIDSMQASNRNMLVIATSVVGIGLLALVVTAYLQSRGMNRLAQIATLGSERALLPETGLTSLSNSEPLMLSAGSGHGTGVALFSTIDRREKRIHELEHTATPTSEEPRERLGRHDGPNGGTAPRPADHVSVLLGKGNVLLSLGQTENALACFEEAIAAAPENPQAHLKRGVALEKLKRRHDAVAAYDRALTLDASLTAAHLGKGNVFNEQERYSEALECYEAALRSEKRA